VPKRKAGRDGRVQGPRAEREELRDTAKMQLQLKRGKVLRRAWVPVGVGVALLAFAACTGSDDEESVGGDEATVSQSESASWPVSAPTPPSSFKATAVCPASIVQVVFDQDEAITVTSGGQDLAFASYTDRAIGATCKVKGPTRSYAFGHLGEEGVYRDARLTCAARDGVEIHVHPVWDGYVGRVGGSVLLVSVPSESKPKAIVSAVLKNHEQASVASRIYYASRYCELA
jgi:hypothetical protein